jgi:NAD(P)-dependent dehydrogenase (short-subunit alcohol dehydrogenase family)
MAIEDEDLDTFRLAMEVNVTAVWHLAKLAGAVMVAKGSGSIVNLASVLGLVGSTPIKEAHYTASKGAVVNLTRELALQWARKGVRVNALCPGWFPSEMTAMMEGDEASQAFIKANSPIPRMGQPSELDGPLLLLASDAGSFMTGHILVVDGGWLAR